jgi:hypothetical protein
MTGVTEVLNANPLPWLLEPDAKTPGVRYFALRDVLGLPADHPEVVAARARIMESGPVPAILAAQEPEGYWVQPGAGYSPKYRGTVWSVMFLAQLGADGYDERVRRGGDYLLEHAQSKAGGFGIRGTPSTTIHCLWGNVARALLDLGFGGDPRLELALDRLARSITGDGYGEYPRTGVVSPGFGCSINSGLPCGWGAVRALWALNAVPAVARSAAIEAATAASVEFLTAYNIARAEYPYDNRISPNWFKFGYPLGYVSDVLMVLEVLTEAGVVDGLDEAVELVLSKQDEQGRWALEYGYTSRMWINVERMGKPSKWITLRALRVLARLGKVPGEWLTLAA